MRMRKKSRMVRPRSLCLPPPHRLLSPLPPPPLCLPPKTRLLCLPPQPRRQGRPPPLPPPRRLLGLPPPHRPRCLLQSRPLSIPPLPPQPLLRRLSSTTPTTTTPRSSCSVPRAALMCTWWSALHGTWPLLALVGSHTGGGNGRAFKLPMRPGSSEYHIERCYTVLCPCTYRRSLHHPSPQSASLAAPSTLTGESNASAAML